MNAISTRFASFLLVVYLFFIVAVSYISPFLSLVLMLLGAVVVFIVSPALIPAYWLVLLLFSNVFIAFWSDHLASELSQKILFSLDFLFCIFAVFLLIFFHPGCCWKEAKMLLPVIVIAGLYFLYGAYVNGVKDAIVYLRSIFYPFLIYFFGITYTKCVRNLDYEDLIIKAGIVAVAFLVLEILFTELVYSIFSVYRYMELKKGIPGLDMYELLDMSTRRLLNSNLFPDTEVIRPSGFILHAVSSAYLFSICFLLSLKMRQYKASILFFFGCVLCGSKGAIVLSLAVLASYLFPILNYRNWMLPSIAFVYSISAIYLGLLLKDPHFYSLVSSIYAMPQNPLGSGLGYGGSLTTGTDHALDFFSINGDSGFAVLLNMVGCTAVFIYWTYREIYRRHDQALNNNVRLRAAFAAYYYFLIANSFFQEEGFSPYSMGLLVFVMALRTYGRKPPGAKLLTGQRTEVVI
ncbi:hypothetical protein [Microbulbifer pacificus]|uniref:hypothetical protein n=1 Tax=Microbulbifer pacificus TaxID=407164 RepID=UPI000CF52386|nr:hypothetical protein [Microbulbifer pacificus]